MRIRIIEVIDYFCDIGCVVCVYFQSDTTQGVGIKGGDTDHGFVFKNERDVFFLEYVFKYQVFVRIGIGRYDHKILQRLLPLSYQTKIRNFVLRVF